MDLGGTDYEFLVRLPPQEGFKTATANHVRAAETVPHEALRHHFRNELGKVFPGVGLVVKALDDGFPGIAPTGAELVVGVLPCQLHEERALLPAGNRTTRGNGIGRIVFEVGGVELEAVHSVSICKAGELTVEPFRRLCIGKVKNCRCSVPPAHRIRAAAVRRHQEAIERIDFPANLVLVHAHEGTYPEHDLEAHPVQLVTHCLRVREPCRMEVPLTVILLPGIVNHDDAGGKAVCQDAPGIFQNTFLVLVVHELYPCVVLRTAVELFRRQFAVCREVGGRCGTVCIGKGFPSLDHLDA